MSAPLRPEIDLPKPDRVNSRQEFARELTLLREQVGLTVREVASRVGVVGAHSTIGDWFSGRGLPSTSSRGVLLQVLRVCGVHEMPQTQQWLSAWQRARRSPRPRPGGLEPYRGLACFQPEHADWFFGRRELTGQLLARLVGLHRAGGGLQLVVGASGSGKSSLLRAGMIPALAAGAVPGSSQWPVLLLTPGPSPLDELAAHLAAVRNGSVTDLAKAVRKDPVQCAEQLRWTATAQSGAGSGPDTAPARPDQPAEPRRLVLVVDQFEELFTAGADEAERHCFVEMLDALAAGPDGALVVIGLRADFYSSVLRYPELVTAVQTGQLAVGLPREAELREVILGPASRAKLEVEDGLVDLLLRDVSPRGGGSGGPTHGSGVLPLLSHALYATWQHGRGRRLTIDHYRAAGGIDRAVATSADRVYHELVEPQRVVARRLFLSLVHVGADTADTRRRVRTENLLAGYDDRGQAEVAHVLDRFVAQRLITADTHTVEISHEALLTAWPQLRRWLDTDRSGQLVEREVAEAARNWNRTRRDPAVLYRGTQLVTALDWAETHLQDVHPVAREFLATSKRHARRRTRRLYQTITALAGLLVLAVTATIVAIYQRTEAETVRDQALSRLVAARADQLRASDVALGRQLALAAYQIAPTPEALASLIDASATMPVVRLQAGSNVGILPSVAFHPRRPVLAAAADTTVRFWDITEPGHPRSAGQLPASSETVYSIVFSPNGQLLATAGADHAIRLWSTADPYQPSPLGLPLTGSAGTVYSVAFSSDARLLATASADSTVRLWDISQPTRPAPLGQPLTLTGPAKSVAFSPDGQTLATAASDASIGLWDLTEPARPRLLSRPTGPAREIGQLTFSPNGRLLAAGSADFNAYLWEVTDPARPTPVGPPLAGAASWINDVAFTPDSSKLALASSDATVGVRIWDLAERRFVATLPHPAPVTAVAFTTDGTALATGANDGTARIWPLSGPVLQAPGVVSATTFSPDGRILAVGSTATQLWDVTDLSHPVPFGPALASPDDFAGTFAFTPDSNTLAVSHGRSGTVQLWNITNPAAPNQLGPPLQAHRDQVESVDFSPDGRTLATGSRDHTVRLWDTTDPIRPRLLATLTGFTGYVSWVTFSPEGRLLAASSADKTVRLWEVADPRRPIPAGPPIAAANHYVYSVRFSPDGRTLATSSADSTVRLWDLQDPASPDPIGAPLNGPTNYVYMLAFSPDGQTLASAATDATLWLWDLTDPKHPTPLATLTDPTGALYTVSFHPDGHTLASGGSAETAWIWNTDPTQATADICTAIGDPITRSEWTRYIPDRTYRQPCRH